MHSNTPGDPSGRLAESRAILVKELLPPIYRFLLCPGSASIRAQRSALCGPRGSLHHAQESVSLCFQELVQHLLDSLNLLEEVRAFLAWHVALQPWRGPL
jgi:hypothetical protein